MYQFVHGITNITYGILNYCGTIWYQSYGFTFNSLYLTSVSFALWKDTYHMKEIGIMCDCSSIVVIVVVILVETVVVIVVIVVVVVVVVVVIDYISHDNIRFEWLLSLFIT